MVTYLQGGVKLWVLSFTKLNSTKTFSIQPFHCLISTESMLNKSPALLACTPTLAPLCTVSSVQQGVAEQRGNHTSEMGQDTNPRETTTLNKPERDLTTRDFFQLLQYPQGDDNEIIAR